MLKYVKEEIRAKNSVEACWESSFELRNVLKQNNLWTFSEKEVRTRRKRENAERGCRCLAEGTLAVEFGLPRKGLHREALPAKCSANFKTTPRSARS
jgi:hypothetical protein